jgi:hypothetical protein
VFRYSLTSPIRIQDAAKQILSRDLNRNGTFLTQ